MTTVGLATGAGHGTGEACAKRLADLVDVLLLVDRNDAAATAVAKALSGSGRAAVEPFAADVTDREDCAKLAERVRELGTLRAVAHAESVEPEDADWRGALLRRVVEDGRDHRVGFDVRHQRGHRGAVHEGRAGGPPTACSASPGPRRSGWARWAHVRAPCRPASSTPCRTGVGILVGGGVHAAVRGH